jgi:hypothetical protein
MKGLNVKRILATSAAIGLLGSSAVAAGVMFGNTELVNDNGQPVAKIVVGSNAAVSDGVAAANIASVLANYAYKSSTLMAGLSGEATCTAGGSSGGSGTCEVSNEKVTIEITMPGEVAGTYEFKTLLSDYIDKKLGNREKGLTGDLYKPDTSTGYLTLADSSEWLNPLRATTKWGVRNLFRIGEEQFSGFSSEVVTDEQATDATYTAYQNFWVGGYASAYSRESTSTYYKKAKQYQDIVGRPRVMAYSLSFKGNDYGIPYCTGEINTSKDWYTCSDSTHQSDNHRIKIPFFGEQWIISKMDVPRSESLTNEQGVVSGGYVKLAKEAKYAIVTVGDELDGGSFKVRLSDIARASTASNVHHALLDIIQGENVVGQIKVTPGQTYTYVHPSTGQSIKVHVYKTAPGIYLHSKWAELAIYTDEIKLEDSEKYKEDGDHDDYKVAVYWKNRDAAASPLDKPDALREIVIYNYDGFNNKYMLAGEAMNFPPVETRYRMVFNGLDLTEADYQDLMIENVGTTEISLCEGSSSSSWNCANTNNITVSGVFLGISTPGDSTGLGGDGAVGTDRTGYIYVDPIGKYHYNATYANNKTSELNGNIGGTGPVTATQVANTTGMASTSPTIFWQTSSDNSYYRYKELTPVSGNSGLNVTGSGYAATSEIAFDAAGLDTVKGLIKLSFSTNMTNGSILDFSDTNYYASNPGGSPIGEILIQEDAGEANVSSHAKVWLRVPVFNLTSDEWRFKSSESASGYGYYAGIDLSNTGSSGNQPLSAEQMEPMFYTERGSKINSVDTSAVSMSIAKKVGVAKYTFSAATTEAAGSSGEEWIATEGEEKTLTNGVKLKVKSIDQTVGTCVASGSTTGSCTVNMNPVKAVLKEKTDAGTVEIGSTAEVSQPYDIRNAESLVITDKDSGAGSNVVISVGGPVVNSVTANILADSPVDFEAKNVVVDSFDNKIVVAGYSAEDTMTAAKDFIRALKKN